LKSAEWPTAIRFCQQHRMMAEAAGSPKETWRHQTNSHDNGNGNESVFFVD
jgi:hypothetical protein